LFLPLLGDYAYEKGAGKKIYLSFWLGAGFVLLFLAVFYGLYTATAPTHHYAFTKTSQYFSALKTVGRVDLLLVYLLSTILFFAHIRPVKLCADCIEKSLSVNNAPVLCTILNAALFLFVLFFDRRQNALAQTVTQTLWWVFPIFSIALPLFCALLLVLPTLKKSKTSNNTQRERKYAN
jgi:hypothetical protein